MPITSNFPTGDSPDAMLKSVYDTDGDGVVDNAAALGGSAADAYMMKSGGIFTGRIIAYSENRSSTNVRNILVQDSTGTTNQSTDSIIMWRK